MKDLTTLENEKFKVVLSDIRRENPNLYYERTDQIAKIIYEHIHNRKHELDEEAAGVLGDLSEEDIRYKLSFTS